MSILGDNSGEWRLSLPGAYWRKADYHRLPFQSGAFFREAEAHVLVFSGRRSDGVAIDLESAADSVMKKAEEANPTYRVLERIPVTVQSGPGVAFHARLSESGVETECWCVVVVAGPRVAVVTAMAPPKRFATNGPCLLSVVKQFSFVSM